MPPPFQSMDHLIGLEGAKAITRRLAASETGVHAVLYYGQPGCGTTSMAMAMAQAWLCTKPTSEGPCGACPVCVSVEAGRAVDLQHMHPWGPSNWLKRECIKDPKGPSLDPFPGISVITYFRTRPLMARNKVVILEHADRLTGDAANALLKTLEEPPATGKLILTTSELGRILPTIRSRALCIACELSDDFRPTLFAESPGRAKEAEEAQEEYSTLLNTLNASKLEPGDALGLARACRAAADTLAKKSTATTRQANAEVARFVASWLGAQTRVNPEAAQFAAESFRAIVQNGSAGMVFDSLFCRVCSTEEPRAYTSK